jgi:hypothetical protein
MKAIHVTAYGNPAQSLVQFRSRRFGIQPTSSTYGNPAQTCARAHAFL